MASDHIGDVRPVQLQAAATRGVFQPRSAVPAGGRTRASTGLTRPYADCDTKGRRPLPIFTPCGHCSDAVLRIHFGSPARLGETGDDRRPTV
jgi:hypothetical protein